jgi:hypothetical protein
MGNTSVEGAPPTFEMAFVLFMDIVGYSLETIDHQTELLSKLQRLVQASTVFQQARVNNEVIFLPTGDGMALAFMRHPLSPVECALQIADSLRSSPEIKLRMGIHAGPVCRHADIRDEVNVVGGGINLAQRVMDCGDAGHILVSRNVAEFLEQLSDWRDCLRDLGTHEVKHSVRVHLYSLFKDGLGNLEMPIKIRVRSGKKENNFPSSTDSGQGQQTGAIEQRPVEYLCYVSRDKIDQLSPDESSAEPCATDLLPQLQLLLESGISYGRPDILQREASLKRDYVRKLQRFLRSHAQDVIPFQPGAVAPGLFWLRDEFYVEKIDPQTLIASLVSMNGSRKLVLHCSLANFSNKCIDGRHFRPTSTNYAFFSEQLPVTLETVFYLISAKGDESYGSPLFLKLPFQPTSPSLTLGLTL